MTSRTFRNAFVWGRQITDDARLILAAKTAAAAAIAWYLAPFVPWADSEYSYYAPLGVLVSMYPTVLGSARAGLQALVGLAIGIALGLGGLLLVSVGAPGVIAVALVIALGIALGGVGALGVGRDWVAIAGVFVLLIGGPAGDEFAPSYLLTMAFGVVVGVAVNLLIIPPLYLRRASGQLNQLRERVSDALREIADALTDRPIEPERFASATDGLPAMLSTVEDEVHQADESSRANPRGRRHVADKDLNSRRMVALQRVTSGTRDLAAALSRAAHDGFSPDAETCEALARSLRACAEIVGAATDDPEAEDKLEAASDALETLLTHLARSPVEGSPYAPAYAYTAAVCIRRIVLAAQEFIEPA